MHSNPTKSNRTRPKHFYTLITIFQTAIQLYRSIVLFVETIHYQNIWFLIFVIELQLVFQMRFQLDRTGSRERKLSRIVLIIFMIAFSTLSIAYSQNVLISEKVLKLTTQLTSSIPADPEDAYQQYASLNSNLDSLELEIKNAFPALADKMNRKSARLNSMAGYEDADAQLSIILPNTKMSEFFRTQWSKLDALEKSFNQNVKSIVGLKELYKIKGYLPVWDSAYAARTPALIKYRDEVIKLVKADIEYLKANAHMFKSDKEDVRMQFVESELSILQKLIILKSNYYKVMIEDGAKKVEFCKTNSIDCYKSEK